MSSSSLTTPGPNRRLTPAPASSAEAGQEEGGQVAPRAIRRYLTVVLALGIPLLALPAVTEIPDGAAILVSTYVLLLGGAILTAHRSGPGGVRQLLAGVLRWNIGLPSWAFVTLALPSATIAIAALTSTLTAPADGWAQPVIDYLIFTFLIGTLALNLWEETAWQGLVQRGLTRRHGLLKGSALTAIPFAMLHVPLSFIGDVGLSEALLSTAVLFVAAPFLRYLIGRTDQTTGGSLLAVGVLHASFNASGAMEVLDGGWQHFAAVVVIASLALLVNTRNRANRPDGATSEATISARIAITVAVVLHMAVLIPFTISSALVAPLWAISALVLLWVFATALLWQVARRHPLATLVVPLLNALLLWAAIAAGEGWLGWSA